MALIQTTVLTSGFSESDLSAYPTGSISPSARKILLLGFTSRRDTTVPAPTSVSGLSLSFVQVDTETHNAASSLSRVTVFRTNTGPSPGSGAITFNMGETHIRGSWGIIELSNVDPGGTDGADAVVQSATGTTNADTSVTATLAAFGDADNATIGFCLGDHPGNDGPYTPGSGFAFDINLLTGSQFNALAVEFKNTNDTTVDFTGTGSGGMAIVGIELKHAVHPATSGASGRIGHAF